MSSFDCLSFAHMEFHSKHMARTPMLCTAFGKEFTEFPRRVSHKSMNRLKPGCLKIVTHNHTQSIDGYRSNQLNTGTVYTKRKTLFESQTFRQRPRFLLCECLTIPKKSDKVPTISLLCFGKLQCRQIYVSVNILHI